MAARTKVFVDIISKTTGSDFKKYAVGIGIAAVAVAGLIKIGKELVNVYAVQEQAEARLEATIKATGKAAGLSADQLKDMASGLQGVTKFGDEAIIGAQSLLLTFKDIGEDVFPRALESILDMSEQMGTGLKESAIQVGKALNDPIQGISALTRVGIQFTDEQKNMIKSLVETGDKAAAQAVILKELESQMGGVARAAADTATGALTQLGNTMGDLQEAYGRNLAEGIQPFVKGLENIVAQMVEAANKAHDLKDALDIIDEGGITSAKQTLLILENQRDKLGQIAAQYEGLDEKANTAWQNAIRQVEDYNESLGITDIFLDKAATKEERRNAAIQGNNDAIETYAQLLKDALTAEEVRLIQLNKEIDELVILKTAAKDYGTEWADIETLLVTLLKEKNELLTTGIELSDEENTSFEYKNSLTYFAIEAFELLADKQAKAAAAKKKADEEEADRIEKLTDLYQDLAETGLGAFASAFKEVGEGNISLWEGFKEAGKDAVSALLEALAKMAIIEAAIAAAKFNFVSAGLLTAAAAGAYAASGFVQSLPTGGQFITDGPTMIGNTLVGDNASGQERVTVEPLGGGDSNNKTGQIMILRIGNRDIKAVVQGWINNRELHSSQGGVI